jgi:hypothetical protein
MVIRRKSLVRPLSDENTVLIELQRVDVVVFGDLNEIMRLTFDVPHFLNGNQEIISKVIADILRYTGWKLVGLHRIRVS